jgi:endopolyphosphatase
LVNATFQWIQDNIKDDIDFVVWTGDSARHDNDEHYPRTDKQVTDLNRFVVNKFVEVFGKDDNKDDPDPTNDFVVPIVPTFGNNDILPHNIFLPGPNKWTRKYEDIWRKFVPQEQRHSFARGGWFFTEVIPNRLAVFSLNTLYFFDSNSAVDGCDAETEPGYEHMEWLRIQLQFLRQRGMKAILIGHVPPARTDSKQNWDESCFQKYNLWLRQYRDVIVSSIFGHMNIDHFMFQDVKDLSYKFHIDGIDEHFERAMTPKPTSGEPHFSISQKAAYLNELRDSWARLPKPPMESSHNLLEGEDQDRQIEKKKKKKKGSNKGDMKKFLRDIGGPWGERFSLSLVSPSVVPNFLPTLRIVEYNITGMEKDHPALGAIGKPATLEDLFTDDREIGEDDQLEDDNEGIEMDIQKKKKKKKPKKPKKPAFPIPAPPSSTAAPGPGYSLQPLSLVSWTQFYANLTTINAEVEKHKLDTESKLKHKHFKFEVEYSISNDTVYNMTDLTMRSWLELAQRIGRNAAKNAALDEPDLDEDVEDMEEPIIEAVKQSDGRENEHPLTEDILNQAQTKPTKKHKTKTKKKVKNHVWKTFIRRVFVGTKPDGDLDDEFGVFED